MAINNPDETSDAASTARVTQAADHTGHYFIAYSRRDFYFAESLFYALQSNRIDAWIDVWNIRPGDNWDRAIENAIKSCKGLILIATKDSLRSPYVRQEIRRAYQAERPIHLVIRGRVSKQDLVIPTENPQGQSDGSIDLLSHAHVIVDMRANFAKGIETLTTCINRNATHKEKLPNRFSLKMERILYLPPIIAVLVISMVITEISTYGIGVFYSDQVPQLMADIRDIAQGNLREILFLVSSIFGTVVSFIVLVTLLVISVNFTRRKRVSDAQFYLLLLDAGLIVGTILWKDLIAAAFDFVANVSNPISVYVKPGEHPPSIGHEPIILFVAHGIIALFIVILGIVFLAAFLHQKGQGAVLRWLPTGWASETIRRNGNVQWIGNLPDITVSPSPPYKSYYIMASPEDEPAATKIKLMLQQQEYLVIDSRLDAECDLIILSPFSDSNLLTKPDEASSLRPAIYVVTRSMQVPSDITIARHWIDYRRPTEDQFWRQWERRFSDLKRSRPTFPYIPETLENSLFPFGYGRSVLFMIGALVITSTMLIWAVEFIIFVLNGIHGMLLPVTLAFMVGAVCLALYTVQQLLRGTVSLAQAKSLLLIVGFLTVATAFAAQNSRMIIGACIAVLVNAFLITAAWPKVALWLPQTLRARRHRSNKKSLLRPISNYRVITSPAGLIVVIGFLYANAMLTNTDIVPYLPQQSASKPYAVADPGPYYLTAPGMWAQDTNASAFGYHFRYGSDRLEITQDEANGYPTWLKFYSVNAAPMRFATHFRSSIHVHFTNSDVRTSVSLGLNDLFRGSLGPMLLLYASGAFRVIKSTAQFHDGQVSQSAMSHDYTLTVEVNGASCTYWINGTEVITFTDPSAASVKDIMISVLSYVPGGMKLSLSDFTYTPLPDPLLGQNVQLAFSAHKRQAITDPIHRTLATIAITAMGTCGVVVGKRGIRPSRTLCRSKRSPTPRAVSALLSAFSFVKCHINPRCISHPGIEYWFYVHDASLWTNIYWALITSA